MSRLKHTCENCHSCFTAFELDKNGETIMKIEGESADGEAVPVVDYFECRQGPPAVVATAKALKMVHPRVEEGHWCSRWRPKESY